MREQAGIRGKRPRLAAVSVIAVLALLGAAVLVLAGTSQAQTQSGGKIALSNIYTPLLTTSGRDSTRLFRCSVVNVGSNGLSVVIRAKGPGGFAYKEETVSLAPGAGSRMDLDPAFEGTFYCQFTIAGSPNAVRASASVAELVYPENLGLPWVDIVAVAAE